MTDSVHLPLKIQGSCRKLQELQLKSLALGWGLGSSISLTYITFRYGDPGEEIVTVHLSRKLSSHKNFLSHSCIFLVSFL